MSEMWVFVLKRNAGYEVRISDGRSDVCSSELESAPGAGRWFVALPLWNRPCPSTGSLGLHSSSLSTASVLVSRPAAGYRRATPRTARDGSRSEEHTSELQSLMRISYAVFCLNKKNVTNKTQDDRTHTIPIDKLHT